VLAQPPVAAVSDRRRRSEIDATIYVALYISPRPESLRLILRRLLDMIDDQDIHGAFRRFELQPKLFLHRREN
jgi:hypothetical protein